MRPAAHKFHFGGDDDAVGDRRHAGGLAGAWEGAAVGQQPASTAAQTPPATAREAEAGAEGGRDRVEGRGSGRSTQAPNQQPNTAPTPDAPTAGDGARHRAHPEGGEGGWQAAPGRHLSGPADGRRGQAGRRRHQRASSNAGSNSCRRARSRDVRSSASSRRPRSSSSEGRASARRRLEGPDPEGQRLRARVDQQGRQPLPDPPGAGVGGTAAVQVRSAR